MPELRKDPVTGRWVIISTERSKRPDDFTHEQAIKNGLHKCPFCEGNEKITPPEIFSIRNNDSKPNTPGWDVRVVPNKFPALRIEGGLDKRGNGIYDMMNGVGAHEVIIESPQHKISLTKLEVDSVLNMIKAYKERLSDLKKDVRFVYGQIFKNVGEAAGASLDHTHSQLIATPVVPYNVEREMHGAETFFNYRGRCLFCDIMDQELNTNKRIIIESEHFVTFNPFASRFPFEIWLMPKKHMTHFETLPNNVIPDLANILKSTLTKLENALNAPAYNYLIHSTPYHFDELEYYHWHIEIIPRITKIAGFEWGSGFYINPVAPENAAEFLRQNS